MPEVTIIMGSISDRPVADKAMKILDELGIGYEVRISSAHRTPGKTVQIVSESDADVFIAIAGLAAHLPGVVAAHTTRPVIAVPCKGALEGLDALLSAVQMPPGVPVGTVGIGRGENAAILAAEILALRRTELGAALENYRREMAEKVENDDASLQGRSPDPPSR